MLPVDGVSAPRRLEAVAKGLRWADSGDRSIASIRMREGVSVTDGLVLIRGGDLAGSVAVRLHRSGFQVVMTGCRNHSWCDAPSVSVSSVRR
jgi:hypothetical protein